MSYDPRIIWNPIAGGVGYTNSWVDFGTGSFAAGRYGLLDGRVYLSGLVKQGTAGGILTLPVGFRPAYEPFFAAPGSYNSAAGLWRVDVTTAGVVNIVSNIVGGGGNALPNDFISLDGIAFALN